MRQVAILPSGCQIFRRASVLYYDSERIIYASSLAVYVLDASTFLIKHILSLNQRAITSIAVSNQDPNLLVVTGRDGTVTLWSISDEESLTQLMVNGSVIAGWNPVTKNQIAILSEESVRLYLWETDRGPSAILEVFSVRNESLKPCVLRWNPKVPGWIAIGCNAGTTFLFRMRDKSHKVLQGDAKANVVDLQWDRLSTSYLLIAYHTFISLWDAESATQIHAFDKQAVHITGIAWMDWTAGNFVSINGKNSYLKVWNASQRTPLESIKVKGDAGLLSLCFCAGNRSVLYSCNDGSIGVFDLKSMKLDYLSAAGHTETIFGCKFSPNSPNNFCTASYDTTVKIWSSPGFELQKTLTGAEDIVYCVDWSPNSRMVTASCANGLVLIWDVETGRELARYLNHTKASYCCAWNPFEERYIASTSADSSLYVMDIDPPALYDLCKSSAPTASRKKGADGYKSQVTLSTVKYRFVHPAAVYGCAWSPFKAMLLCTACQDGTLRVFNIAAKSPLMLLLQGHNARAFSCVWSPLQANMLATGSDDQTIGVWRIDVETVADPQTATTRTVEPLRRLSGHRGFVRALCWNFEHEQLLLSGSWDFSIKLWNVETGEVLHTVTDHIADVYAITSHPQRPFSYLSASRDTTVRMWELEGLFCTMRYRTVWDGGFDKIRAASGAAEVAAAKRLLPSRGKQLLSSLSPFVKGHESRMLHEDLRGEQRKAARARGPTTIGGGEAKRGPASDPWLRSESPLEQAFRFYRIFSFFSGNNGSMELWENALFALCEDGDQVMDVAARVRPNTQRKIFHEREVLGNEKSVARKLEASKMSAKKSDLSQRGEEQLVAAAQTYAKLGDFAHYCSIMVDLGRWEAALAMAPSVSMDFWKYLSFMYAQHLSGQSAEECVPFYLAIGKDAHAIDHYLQHRDPASALVVAKMSEQRTDIVPDYSWTVAPPKEAALMAEASPKGTRGGRPPMIQALSTAQIDLNWSLPSSPKPSDVHVRERTEREVDQSRSLIGEVATCAARQQLAVAQPMLAAAQHLAVNDVDGAIDLLLDSGELDAAFALAVCFRIDTAPLLSLWADRCAATKDLPLAMDILGAHPFAEIERGLLLSKYCDESTAQILAADHDLKPPTWWAGHAKEEEAIGSDADAVMAYVIAQQFTKAAMMGMSVLKRFLRDPWGLSAAAFKIVHALKCVDATRLDEPLRANFMCHMLWLGAHEAAAKGLMACAANMLDTLLVLRGAGASFLVSEADMTYQLLFFRILAGQAEALALLEKVLAQLPGELAGGAVGDGLKALRVIMTDRSAWAQWQRLVQPQTSTMTDAAASLLALNIIREIQQLGEALALPSLSALNDKKGKESDGARLLELLQRSRAVVLGSLLPVANQNLKHYMSTLSHTRIQGSALQLDDAASFVSVNEAAQWRRVLPFAPLSSGELLL